LKSANICGQADRIEIVNDLVNVYDYKTNKKIDLEAFTNWEGITKKMYPPIEHIDDCNFMHYALQLSIYMYIILKHNHNLRPGKLMIQHITFEIEDTDQFGFPIASTDLTGDPVVKEVVPYDLPYLKSEVVAMLQYLKLNPQLLKND